MLITLVVFIYTSLCETITPEEKTLRLQKLVIERFKKSIKKEFPSMDVDPNNELKNPYKKIQQISVFNKANNKERFELNKKSIEELSEYFDKIKSDSVQNTPVIVRKTTTTHTDKKPEPSGFILENSNSESSDHINSSCNTSSALRRYLKRKNKKTTGCFAGIKRSKKEVFVVDVIDNEGKKVTYNIKGAVEERRGLDFKLPKNLFKKIIVSLFWGNV